MSRGGHGKGARGQPSHFRLTQSRCNIRPSRCGKEDGTGDDETPAKGRKSVEDRRSVCGRRLKGSVSCSARWVLGGHEFLGCLLFEISNDLRVICFFYQPRRLRRTTRSTPHAPDPPRCRSTRALSRNGMLRKSHACYAQPLDVFDLHARVLRRAPQASIQDKPGMLARPGHSPEVIESLPAVPVAAAAGAPKRPAVVVVKSATGAPPVATKPAVPALPPVRPRAQTKRVESRACNAHSRKPRFHALQKPVATTPVPAAPTAILGNGAPLTVRAELFMLTYARAGVYILTGVRTFLVCRCLCRHAWPPRCVSPLRRAWCPRTT